MPSGAGPASIGSLRFERLAVQARDFDVSEICLGVSVDFRAVSKGFGSFCIVVVIVVVIVFFGGAPLK